jgi:hypothetical protein
VTSLSRRGWLAVVAGAALVVGLVLLRSHDRGARPDDGAARAAENNDLEIKMARLQGKLAALESRVSTPAPTQEDPNAAPAAAPAPAPAPNPPPRRRTREEQTAIFEGYFDRLDSLRGTRDDGALTKQFAASLAAVNPEHKSLHGAKVDSVACGNGLCRVELTFASTNDLDMGKLELQFQIGPLSGATTMYADPERPHLFAYFAAPGTELPPFPRD